MRFTPQNLNHSESFPCHPERSEGSSARFFGLRPQNDSLIKLFLFLLICQILFPIQNSYGQLTGEDLETARIERTSIVDKILDIPRKIFHKQRLEKKAEEKPGPKTFADKLDLHYGVNEGYERNVLLDSSHKGSFFTGQILGASFTDKIKNAFVYRVGYKIRHRNYSKFSDHNILVQTMSAETALRLIPHKLYLETDYYYRIFRRQHTPLDDFNENEVKVGLKNYLIKDTLYQKPSYIFRHYGYRKFKARNSEGEHGLEGRKDNINAFDHEIGIHIAHNLLIRVHNQIGRANSNDQLLDFYDYTYYQVIPVVSYHPAKDWLVNVGYYFQRKNFDERDVYGLGARENLQSVFGGAYYHFNKNVTWKFNATYIRSDTNIAELEFQDASFLTGLEFHF